MPREIREKPVSIEKFVRSHTFPDGEIDWKAALKQLRPYNCGHISKKSTWGPKWRDIPLKRLTLKQLRELLAEGQVEIRIGWLRREVIAANFSIYKGVSFFIKKG